MGNSDADASEMNILLNDPDSSWPEGESISLVAENDSEKDVLTHLGNFMVRHGWNACISCKEPDVNAECTMEAEKLFIIPKAAKPKP